MSYLKSKSFDDMVRQKYAETPSDAISYKKFKAMTKKSTMHLLSGSSPSLFSFQYNDEDEHVEVTKHLTHLLSKKFDEEILQHYNNDESVNTIINYKMFKESCANFQLLMLFHDLESKRTVKPQQT